VVNLDSTLVHHLFQLSIADRVGHIPANTPQDHLSLEVTAFELDHHKLLARQTDHDHTSACSPPKVCDKTRRTAVAGAPKQNASRIEPSVRASATLPNPE